MVSMSNLVTRPPEQSPNVSEDVFRLLNNYTSYIKGEFEAFDRALSEKVQQEMDNTWNNADVSAAKAEANKRDLEKDIQMALDVAKEGYAKCLSCRLGFALQYERISEQGRGLRCIASWVVNEETGGRHLRHSSPRDMKPVGLAHFVRLAIESALIA